MSMDSLKALGENWWFKAGARLFMWVAGPAIVALVGVALTLRADINSTRDFSQMRAKDNEAFQSQTLSNDANTRAQLEILRTGQANQGLLIANMSGVLNEMQRQQTAQRNAEAFTPTR